ncbi:hypothetical protein [Haloplanus halobius]|uniref:hypothetical protein n=1 Tax=Haloplanus halobius TaxID=2934938 RepID=UPI00200C9A92|nr:hypothetical protein [Haloplanus sp. XH21]
MPERPPGPDAADGFFDRFVHPWLARVAALGLGLWAIAFLLATGGLAARDLLAGRIAVQLFFYSGVLGTLGILILGVCTVILAGFFVRRELGAG